METVGNIFLDSSKEVVMKGRRDRKSLCERNPVCFPASPEHPGRNLHESGYTGRDEGELMCPAFPPQQSPSEFATEYPNLYTDNGHWRG